MTLRAYLNTKRGRTTLLAKALGVSVAIVSMWANKQRRIPAEQCDQISRITGVPKTSLRRDVFSKTS